MNCLNRMNRMNEWLNEWLQYLFTTFSIHYYSSSSSTTHRCFPISCGFPFPFPILPPYFFRPFHSSFTRVLHSIRLNVCQHDCCQSQSVSENRIICYSLLAVVGHGSQNISHPAIPQFSQFLYSYMQEFLLSVSIYVCIYVSMYGRGWVFFLPLILTMAAIESNWL